ncbi:MAG: phospholipase D-like domain-containing protein [Desulfobacterales bacterium]|jgi:cardiolipin synthase
MDYRWLLLHILPSLGFVLALLLLAHILREKRPPTSTLTWLMAIVFIPYVGVPLYLVFGGRKMLRRADSKPALKTDGGAPLIAPDAGGVRMLAAEGGVFPASTGNRIALLPEGEQAFRTILDLIGSARRSIHVATFILGKDETGRAIVEALARKASQGCEVRLLLDALGSVKVSRKFLAPLLSAGGQAADFMPMIHLPFRGRANLRNHRKMLICDDRAAVIGGMNLASEYMGPRDFPGRWRDLSLLVEGPVVEDIAGVFRSDWGFASKSPLEAPSNAVRDAATEPGGIAQLVASGPDVANDSLRNAILTEIFMAKRRIWAVTPYFVPDELLLEALCIAIRRNVDVSIITPKKSNHLLADIVREGYLTRIQEAGGAVRLYEPRMLHAKAILVDDTIAMVGSANMDMRSLLLNYEIALCSYDREAIGQLESWMRGLVERCSPRALPPRSTFGLVESVGRLFAPLL